MMNNCSGSQEMKTGEPRAQFQSHCWLNKFKTSLGYMRSWPQNNNKLAMHVEHTVPSLAGEQLQLDGPILLDGGIEV